MEKRDKEMPYEVINFITLENDIMQINIGSITYI